MEDCADVIGAAVGASRAAADAGWIEDKFRLVKQVKQFHQPLHCMRYIRAIHLAGMGSSKVIVAINKDPEANIFNVADYGIVGDLEIVPLLTEEFKN